MVEVGAGASLAVVAAAALALQPKLIAHAQNSPKDLPGLFVFTLGALMLARLAARPSLARALAAAASIGLAITTWLPAIALAPLAAFILLAPRRGATSSRPPEDRHEPLSTRALRLTAVGGGALAIAVASWPWLWSDPIARLGQIAGRLADFPTGFDVLYFGRLHPSNALPWHYTLGSILVSTPLVVSLFAILGAAEVARAQDPRRRRLAAIALVWIASLLLLDGLASFHYDGMRHVLAVLPAIAILAALGADRARAAIASALQDSVSARTAGAAAALVLALPAIAIAIDLARLHPYQDAYLAWPLRRLRPGASEQMFEIEYWGGSYRAAARWLNDHAEPGAVVLAPIAPHCLEPYLRSDLTVHERLRPRLRRDRASLCRLHDPPGVVPPARARSRGRRRPSTPLGARAARHARAGVPPGPDPGSAHPARRPAVVAAAAPGSSRSAQIAERAQLAPGVGVELDRRADRAASARGARARR